MSDLAIAVAEKLVRKSLREAKTVEGFFAALQSAESSYIPT